MSKRQEVTNEFKIKMQLSLERGPVVFGYGPSSMRIEKDHPLRTVLSRDETKSIVTRPRTLIVRASGLEGVKDLISCLDLKKSQICEFSGIDSPEEMRMVLSILDGAKDSLFVFSLQGAQLHQKSVTEEVFETAAKIKCLGRVTIPLYFQDSERSNKAIVEIFRNGASQIKAAGLEEFEEAFREQAKVANVANSLAINLVRESVTKTLKKVSTTNRASKSSSKKLSDGEQEKERSAVCTIS